MNRLEEITRQAKASMNARQEASKPAAVVLELPRRKALYQAFSAPTPDAQIRLGIYAKQMYVMPRYDALYDIVFTGHYDFVGLVFPHQRVKIHGRNLSGLVTALRTNSVEWLREYIEPHFELPEDDGTLPVITEIQIDGAAINPFES